jgi:arylsulfatase A-like enzyme
VNGGWRRALLATPPADVRLRTRVPSGARLRLAFGVERPARPIPGGVPVRFSVAVDGRDVFAREVDPVSRKRDRGWLEEDVDLGTHDAEVELTLATRTAGDGPAVGTPGWSQLRLVREQQVRRQPANAPGPSVLVLLVDTLRADRLGCYGAGPAQSPNLDRLAASGRVFDDAVSQSSWTVPSVATLFTGLHPRSHGVWGAAHDAPGDAAGIGTYLPDELVTLARAAQHAGVTTFGASANPLVSRGTNFAAGFETFVEFGLERRFGGGDLGRNWASAKDVNDRFVAWLQRNRGHRFLAYLHYMEPHDPYTPPDAPPAAAGVRPALARGQVFPVAQKINWHGGNPLPAPEVDHLRALYDGEVRAWDAQLGVLLAALERLSVRESTVIIVTADHGEEFQEHGKLRHGVNLYEETIRVPFVVAGPGIAPGRVPTQIQGIDLFPTVATLLGIMPPAGLPGRNVLGAVDRRPAFAELGGNLVAVRSDGWKLITRSGDDRRELYDLRADPGERTNRFGTVPEGATLTTLLAGWQDAPPPPPVTGSDPRIMQKLRALGYVE